MPLHKEASHFQHPSVISESLSAFERYEFLGDKVLGFCMADILLRLYPKKTEGELSSVLNTLVSKEILSKVAKRLELIAHFQHKLQTISPSVLASMCEVVIADLYVQKGTEHVKDFIKEHWQAWLIDLSTLPLDYKTLLQEYSARANISDPVYLLEKKSGPAHCTIFVCSVNIAEVGSADGSGRSKKEAEINAVKNLCIQCKIEL
ncbi:MAG: putative dsRNA-binding protein [Alphaproteobacteria bacterium]|nr:putative dsRNA-binding protein [Alphaproteobacteria bacterium]